MKLENMSQKIRLLSTEISMIRIKLIEENEIPVLIDMVGGLLSEIMSTMNQAFFDFDPQAALEQAQQLIGADKYFVLIVWHDDQAVGVITAYESYALYTQGAYGTIPECYVVPDYRGKGIGKKLIASMVDFAKDKGWHRLEVTTPPLPEFEDSLRFYQHNGFEISGGKKLKFSW